MSDTSIVVTKTKQIKFRAKSIRTGEYVYGDLAHIKCRVMKPTPEKIYIVSHGAHGGMIYLLTRERVDPDTVEQLIGYDAVGFEVYSQL